MEEFQQTLSAALLLSRIKVKELVDEYCKTQRHPDLPPFVVHPHTFSSWWRTPVSSGPGCYAIFGSGGELLYIGKASLNATTGSRLAAHLRHVRPSWIATPPTYVDIIEVTFPFESPSLEEYLLTKIATLYNSQGHLDLRSLTTAAVADTEIHARN